MHAFPLTSLLLLGYSQKLRLKVACNLDAALVQFTLGEHAPMII